MTDSASAISNDLPRGVERAELILHHLDRLPALPAVAARVLALAASDDSDARDLALLIESDASLTAGLLRLARRAEHGLREQGMTVAKAITLLGFRAVRNAVLSMKIHAVLSKDEINEDTARHRGELWKHSLAVACAAEQLSEAASIRIERGQAFVCGLLHDVGKLALSACLPKSYGRAIDVAQDRHVCICDAERDLFNIDHTVAGKRLATRWKLPVEVVESIWLHHHAPDALPSSLVNPNMVRLVQMADRLARRQRMGFSGYIDTDDPLKTALLLGIKRETLDAIAEGLPQSMERYCELVGLKHMNSARLCAESLAKANDELARLNERLARNNERLEIRSICLDLLARFTDALANCDREADVCAAAAEAVGHAFPCDRVLIAALDQGRNLANLGWWSRDKDEIGSSITTLRRAHPLDESHTGQYIPDEEGDHGASFAHQIWKTCFGSAPLGSLIRIPFGQSQTHSDVLLIEGVSGAVHRLREAATECKVVTDALELAIANARMRSTSERMNEDLVDAHRRLRQAQPALVRGRTVEMIAKMAGGAGHELGTPLAIISGRAQLLRDKLTDPSDRAALETIIEQARKIDSIVIELIDFARPPSPRPELQRLADVFDEVALQWRSRAGLTNDQLTISLEDPDSTVFADPQHVVAIMDSVLANAVAAVSPESARLQINSRSLASDDFVRIVVTDNGVGMSADELEHAIDPFYSNRPAGRGRGLGLSRAYRLAEINGGRLFLKSTLGEGTAVSIELPACGNRHEGT